MSRYTRLTLLVDPDKFPLMSQWVEGNRYRWQGAVRNLIEQALRDGTLPIVIDPPKRTRKKKQPASAPSPVVTQPTPALAPVSPQPAQECAGVMPAPDGASDGQSGKSDVDKQREIARKVMQENARRALMKNDF